MNYHFIMVKFLVSVAFRAATFIRGRCLLESDAYSELSVSDEMLIRGQRFWGPVLITGNTVH